MHPIDNDMLQGHYVSKKSAKHMGIGQQRLQTLKNS